jgi:hypothetical protein
MHELVHLYTSWSATMYSWARTAVGILLWFWVVSGAVFVLRFLAFVLMDKGSETSKFAAVSAPNPFPVDTFHESTRGDGSQE